MKKIVFFGLLLALAACNSTGLSTHQKTEIEQQILNRFDSLAESAKRLDHAAYFAHFDTQHFTALNDNGTVTHKFAQFQQHFSTGIAVVDSYTNLSFDKVKVTVIDDDNAILVNEYAADLNLKNGAKVSVSGAGSQVWHKTQNQWLLVSVSSSTK